MARMKDTKAPPASKPASGTGKQKKKKWNKGKKNEKQNNMVLFDRTTYDKFISEAPKFKLITPSILSDKLRTLPFFDVVDVAELFFDKESTQGLGGKGFKQDGRLPLEPADDLHEGN